MLLPCSSSNFLIIIEANQLYNSTNSSTTFSKHQVELFTFFLDNQLNIDDYYTNSTTFLQNIENSGDYNFSWTLAHHKNLFGIDVNGEIGFLYLTLTLNLLKSLQEAPYLGGKLPITFAYHKLTLKAYKHSLNNSIINFLNIDITVIITFALLIEINASGDTLMSEITIPNCKIKDENLTLEKNEDCIISWLARRLKRNERHQEICHIESGQIFEKIFDEISVYSALHQGVTLEMLKMLLKSKYLRSISLSEFPKQMKSCQIANLINRIHPPTVKENSHGVLLILIGSLCIVMCAFVGVFFYIRRDRKLNILQAVKTFQINSANKHYLNQDLLKIYDLQEFVEKQTTDWNTFNYPEYVEMENGLQGQGGDAHHQLRFDVRASGELVTYMTAITIVEDDTYIVENGDIRIFDPLICAKTAQLAT